MVVENKNTQSRYNLPSEIIFCKKCTISNQRPRIFFDEEGVCSACRYAEFKRSEIDWQKRLERDKFAWPRKSVEEVVHISTAQFEWLLDGYDVWKMKPFAELHFERES